METAEQWLASVVFAAWRYNWRGFYIEPRTRAECELETRLWCCIDGVDPARWYEWCGDTYDSLPGYDAV